MLKGIDNRKFLVWASALFLYLSGLVILILALCGVLDPGSVNVVSAQSAFRMQTVVKKIDMEITPKNLQGGGEDMQALYDGDATTSFGSGEAVRVTLDLGKPRRLAGVRYLPDIHGLLHANRCIGTRFLVANADGVYRPVATVETTDSGDLLPEWKEVLFDTAGEYRYLRVEIPADGYFGEIEWLEYSEWDYLPGKTKGKQDLSMGFHINEIVRDTDAIILTAVYDQSGVMTNLIKTEESFRQEQDATLNLTIPDVSGEENERYQIMVWEKDGTPAIPSPLQYRDNHCAPDLSLPNMFSDDMMLQAEKPLTVWGKGPDGQQVTVTLTDENGTAVTKQTTVNREFGWEVNLGSFPHGGNYRMTVECNKQVKEYRDIVFGDVWLCIGQSNMDYFMLGGKDTENYLSSAKGKKEVNNPNIRLLNLWSKGTGGSGGMMENLPLAEGEKAWTKMNMDAANYCSAVGYFFAQGLEQEYDIPIGLLSVAVGDTEINRWLPCGESFGTFTSTDGGLYNNRIAPLQKLQIRGILMYQGEADQYRTNLTTVEYQDALVGLIDLYRGIWGEEIPFYWTQLTRYKEDESAIREGQRLALQKIQNPKNTGVISLIDLYGEYESGQGNCREDIHPHQKQEVAERFLRYAKRDVYGAEIPVSGPIYQSARRVGKKLELTFAATGDLTVLPVEQYTDKVGRAAIKKSGAKTSLPGSFEIAGKDGVYYPAKATIKGNTVLLESLKVKVPLTARYAWGAYPEMPNLTDETGLPALSFSTEVLP